jgi:hypothetical protein
VKVVPFKELKVLPLGEDKELRDDNQVESVQIQTSKHDAPAAQNQENTEIKFYLDVEATI